MSQHADPDPSRGPSCWELLLTQSGTLQTFVAPPPADPLEARLASSGGFAAGVSALASAQGRGLDWPLVFALGAAVEAGLPTAARLTILARSPLTGAYTDGQVGSAFARTLAHIAPTLVIHGRTRERRILLLEADRSARLLPVPFAPEESLPRRCEILARAHATAAVLACGPAAEAGLSSAALGAGVQPTSFTGRGGLGRALCERGLVAIVVRGPRVRATPAADWLELLARSPRLIERAQSGTLESALALALEAEQQPTPFALEHVSEHKHGCAGCPTPCGFVFERTRQGLHHSALAPLHAHDPARAQARLEQLNRLGIDSKTFAAWLDQHPDLEPAQLLFDPRFQGPPPPRPPRRLLARLAQDHALRNADPMRTSPFLLHDAPDAGALRAALAPLPLSVHGADPNHPEHKGRVLWWHENFLAALDTSGFCAFSASALLSDGLLTLPQLLARLHAPHLLEIGAQALLLLAKLRGRAQMPVEPEYAALRGLEPDGSVSPWAIEAARGNVLIQTAQARLLATTPATAVSTAVDEPALSERAIARLHLGFHGSLAQSFGAERTLELELPCRLETALAALGEHALLAQASAWRNGSKLERSAWVRAGERVDLVVALSGG
ncbi:MAG: hypothetical protein RL277_2611 [Planctomycetota bacterium]